MVWFLFWLISYCWLLGCLGWFGYLLYFEVCDGLRLFGFGVGCRCVFLLMNF